MSIRPAEPEEAAALTDLALRAKASHGYDDAFMRRVRSELTLTREFIADHPVFVVDEEGRLGGFYSLLVDPPACEMDMLFVDPGAHGKGYGRLLWRHAVEEARALGCAEMTVQSDPYAVPFYEAMGATRMGESASPSTGRMLPVLRVSL